MPFIVRLNFANMLRTAVHPHSPTTSLILHHFTSHYLQIEFDYVLVNVKLLWHEDITAETNNVHPRRNYFRFLDYFRF